MTSRWRYWGLVPITILIGAAVGFDGPFSIPPKWSQSGPGHCCLAAPTPTELRPATSASQIVSISVPLPGFGNTITPVAAPAPLQFQVATSQSARDSVFWSEAASAFGSGPSPRTYMAAFVPAKFTNAAISFGLSSSSMMRGALYLSNASCASAARAFASAVSFRNCSPWVVSVAIFSADAVRSASQYRSFTPVIRTMTIVDTTPTTKLAMKNKFAISAILFASGNDGHIRMPFWFPAGAILIVILAGIAGIFPPVRRCVV